MKLKCSFCAKSDPVNRFLEVHSALKLAEVRGNVTAHKLDGIFTSCKNKYWQPVMINPDSVSGNLGLNLGSLLLYFGCVKSLFFVLLRMAQNAMSTLRRLKSKF